MAAAPASAPAAPTFESLTRDPREPITLRARDGFPLAAMLHHAQGPERALVVINSATAVKQGYYARFAEHLASLGLTTLTYDYRGIGGSRTSRSADAASFSLHAWGEEDVAGALAWAYAHTRRRVPLFVIGHSAGGQLVGLADGNERIDAMLNVGSQIGDYRLWPTPARYRMALHWWVLIPGVTSAFGYLPGAIGVGEDLPKGVALEWAEWGRTRDALLGDRYAHRRASFARVRADVRAYSFPDDDYGPRVAVERLHAFYANAHVEHRHVIPAQIGKREIGHFGFFRRAYRDTLWKEGTEWLLART